MLEWKVIITSYNPFKTYLENEQLATPRQAAAVTQAQVSVEWTSTSLEEEREKNVMVNEFYEIKII